MTIRDMHSSRKCTSNFAPAYKIWLLVIKNIFSFHKFVGPFFINHFFFFRLNNVSHKAIIKFKWYSNFKVMSDQFFFFSKIIISFLNYQSLILLVNLFNFEFKFVFYFYFTNECTFLKNNRIIKFCSNGCLFFGFSSYLDGLSESWCRGSLPIMPPHPVDTPLLGGKIWSSSAQKSNQPKLFAERYFDKNSK